MAFRQILETTKKELKKVRSNFSHPYFDKFKRGKFSASWDLYKLTNTNSLLNDYLYDGWVRPLGNEKIQSKKEFFWPFYTNGRYNRELTKFMFSFRGNTSMNRNINNLLFLTGPESSGKSWLLNYNLQKISEVKHVLYIQKFPYLIFHVDLKQHQSLNFDSFLDLFEKKIISVLCDRQDEMYDDRNIISRY